VRRARRLCRSLLENRGTEEEHAVEPSQGVLGILSFKQPALCKHWLGALAAAVRCADADDDDADSGGGGGGGGGGEVAEPPLWVRVCMTTASAAREAPNRGSD